MLQKSDFYLIFFHIALGKDGLLKGLGKQGDWVRYKRMERVREECKYMLRYWSIQAVRHE